MHKFLHDICFECLFIFQEDPDILKWKHGGPKFIELLDKCFKGAIATGFSLYKPYEDQLHGKDQNLFLKTVMRITQLLRMKEMQIILMLAMKYNPTQHQVLPKKERF